MGNKNNAKFSENTEMNETATEPVTTPVVEENKEEEVITTPEEVTEPVTEVETEPVTEVETEPVTEVETEPETIPEEDIVVGVVGTVVKCTRLNVRKEANKDAKVTCVVANGTELTVDMDASTDTFYKVHGICKEVLFEGYCVKDFIEIK